MESIPFSRIWNICTEACARLELTLDAPLGALMLAGPRAS